MLLLVQSYGGLLTDELSLLWNNWKGKRQDVRAQSTNQKHTAHAMVADSIIPDHIPSAVVFLLTLGSFFYHDYHILQMSQNSDTQNSESFLLDFLEILK